MIRAAHPAIGDVVLGQYVEPDDARRLFEHGSDGRAYLLKERVADLDELGAAIRRVADGGSVVDPKVVEALIGVDANRDSIALDRLTDRERDVLAEMAAGKGTDGNELYLLLNGVLVVELDGEQLAELGPGAVLGERAALEGGVRTATLRAVTDCKVAAVPADAFDQHALVELADGHRREESPA